jgi:hypothetical protein
LPGLTAGASPVGSAAIILRSTAQAIPAVQAEAIAEEAAMGEAAAEAEAVNNSPALTTRSVLIYRKRRFLDSFQFAFGISLESLEKRLFLFASGHHLQYRSRRITERLARSS